MRSILKAVVVVSLVSAPALAADFKCSGDRVEKGGSTKGKAVKRGSKYAVEVGGSTVATFENGKIEKGGSSWATVSEAQNMFDCGGDVAATLWVLMKNGNL